MNVCSKNITVTVDAVSKVNFLSMRIPMRIKVIITQNDVPLELALNYPRGKTDNSDLACLFSGLRSYSTHNSF